MLVESRLLKQAHKTVKQLDRVFELGKELTLDMEVNELLQKISDSVRRTLGWNVVILDKLNITSKKYENVCALGIKSRTHDFLRNQYPDKLFGTARENYFQLSQSHFVEHN